ncbi:uncharacterized protein DNG_07528 [Cephalotrichum gorgonifer]|uniref:Fucose-specific lectin n=1 Tax=Cephalotrichum gorgonifer TaxID=2041049 RepID=A0AAE8SXJ0_9PEZI|nr:uncharacterized protein DNG_07528 [Cephalotrichum gorgonifer]
MPTLSTTIILFLGFALPFLQLASGKKIVVNIAAAYASEINDGWASNTEEGHHNLVVCYLDKDDAIIKHAFRHEGDGKYLDASTIRTKVKSTSGLAAVRVGPDDRLYYIDKDAFVTEYSQDNERRLGPKAATGSGVSAAVPVNSTDIHVFFVTENSSLSSLTWDGSEWSKDLEDFASDSTMAFAAVAWSDPLIIRIFYINEHRSAGEWTFEDGSWTNTTDTLPSENDTIEPGQPVAASRSGQIATYEVPPPPEDLSPDGIAGVAAGTTVPTVAILVALLVWWKKPEQIKKLAKKVFRRRDQKAGAGDSSSE